MFIHAKRSYMRYSDRRIIEFRVLLYFCKARLRSYSFFPHLCETHTHAVIFKLSNFFFFFFFHVQKGHCIHWWLLTLSNICLWIQFVYLSVCLFVRPSVYLSSSSRKYISICTLFIYVIGFIRVNDVYLLEIF